MPSSSFWQRQTSYFLGFVFLLIGGLATSCQSARPSYSFQPAFGTASTYPTAASGGAPQAESRPVDAAPILARAAQRLAPRRLRLGTLCRRGHGQASARLIERGPARHATPAVHPAENRAIEGNSNENGILTLIILVTALCLVAALGLTFLVQAIFGTGFLASLGLVLGGAYVLLAIWRLVFYLWRLVGASRSM